MSNEQLTFLETLPEEPTDKKIKHDDDSLLSARKINNFEKSADKSRARLAEEREERKKAAKIDSTGRSEERERKSRFAKTA